MKTFKHYNAKSVQEASELLAEYDGNAMINAGGTDLLGCLKDKCVPAYPEAVINIKSIPGLDSIKSNGDELQIGALVKLADIAASPKIKRDCPLLAEAASAIASPNIRNMATIGGNLVQEVRCWYYRYPRQIGGPVVCLRKGGKMCNALLGDNRYHSIFGAAPAPERRCSNRCPAHIDIPGYLHLVRDKNIQRAAQLLLSRNPFPAITGRVCPVYCEPKCNRSGYDDPVAVHLVEKGVGDYILDRVDEFFAPPNKESGKSIAIIGSGPAGLAAAFYLRKSGHKVTVYEKLPELGGRLLEHTPPFRLPKELIARQIQALINMGIGFEAGVEMTDSLAARLKTSSDAIFVTGGTVIESGQATDISPFANGPGIFIGGDTAKGPSTVICAVAAARKSVEEIESFLGYAEKPDEKNKVRPAYAESRFVDVARTKVQERPPAGRLRGIEIEDVAGLKMSEIENEASRCLNCGCLAVAPSDLATVLVTLDASLVTSKRTIPAEEFFVATDASSNVLELGEVIEEIRIPKPPKEAKQRYLRFTLRKPIDFAIVSVASMITATDGICSDARITLGAVAPSPVRAIAAEAEMRGKPINEETAVKAAKAALAETWPLSMNSYKVEIARTLVKRAILGISD
jgi:CO/xanthine dehydrogenase FAD-binding subunit